MFHNIFRCLKIAKNLKKNGEEDDFLSFHFNNDIHTYNINQKSEYSL